MSAFSDWFHKTLTNVETGFLQFVTALEPVAEQAAGLTIQAGVNAALSTSGTAAQKLQAGLAAVETTGQALAPQLATISLQTGLHLAIAANPTLLGAGAPATPQ